MRKKHFKVLGLVVLIMAFTFTMAACDMGTSSVEEVEEADAMAEELEAELGALSTDEYPAAPSVAAELLKEAGISPRYGSGRDGGNYIRDVAHKMNEDEDTDFNGVEKTDIDAYRRAVALFLIEQGADGVADLFEATLESVVYEGVCDKFGSHIGDTLTFTFSNDIFVDEEEQNWVYYTGQNFWFPDRGKSYIDVDDNKLTITIGPDGIYSSPRLMTDQSITDFDGVLDFIGNPVVVPDGGVEIDVISSGKEFFVTQNSSQNDYNFDEGRPYIEWEKDGTEITFTFVNPTPHAFVFDYRIDGEEGEEHDWSDILIGEGELEGEYIGPWYNPVTVIDDTHEVTVTAEKEVWVGVRVGAEQNWYLDWIVFELQCP